ncbi:MAG: YihY/virulence factor BrkB family protein [Proteobacteria bacterium]|nr:YihY/virulence factor BrkB family protein [Pseudomonadota bacterium]
MLVCAGIHWNADNASTTGAALAFFCAFSLAPLLVILLAIAGVVVGEQAAFGQLQDQLQGLFGPSTAKTVMGAVRASQHSQGWISTSISIVTLLVGASTVLSALQTALNTIWESGKAVLSGVKGVLWSRLLSFGFILTLAFLLLISLTISTALSNVRSALAHRHPALVTLLGLTDFGVSLVIVTALFTLIYRYMPARRVPWKVVILGGFLTAVLFDLGRWAISLYLAHSTQPSAFGAAASFAALLLWLYYTAQIFLFGAEFTACLAGIRAGHEEPAVHNPDGRRRGELR